MFATQAAPTNQDHIHDLEAMRGELLHDFSYYLRGATLYNDWSAQARNAWESVGEIDGQLDALRKGGSHG